jgi:hypothetical protein
MTKYEQLKNAPIKLNVCKNPREVHFNVVSCMCDNRHIISFKKKENGEWDHHGNGQAMSNFKLKLDSIDLNWSAEDGAWKDIFNAINNKYQFVEKIRSR